MIVQGSDAWKQQRLGKVTASRVSDVIAKTKTGWGASRANYQAELVAERLTGVPADRYTNSAMAWGTDTEPQARAAYEFYHSVEVKEVGFIDHPKILMTGCSPDGFVGNGLVEIKCPNTATHIETLLSKKVPDKYVVQMLWQMECTERAWCDFVSYDPRMPEHLALFVKRIRRDEARLKEMSAMISDFLSEVDQKIASLEAIAGQDISSQDAA